MREKEEEEEKNEKKIFSLVYRIHFLLDEKRREKKGEMQ
jgi:hypothetical protein